MTLYHDDCFNVFPKLKDKSIDLVLCDMPYGTTPCKWDTVLDLTLMWEQLIRISNENSGIVLFAGQPFTSVLICSNLKMFKYSIVWEKSQKTNFLNAKKQPLRKHEDIAVFYQKQPTYNLDLKDGQVSGGNTGSRTCGKYAKDDYVQTKTGYPTDVVKFPHANNNNVHPTQKPVALMEYLIKTYSSEGDTVLDFCMGSGTTGVACKRLNRDFIGVEKEEKYFLSAQDRIEKEN